MDKWLRNNTVVKIVALLIGILLWVVVHMDVQSPNGTTSTTLPEDKINNVSVTPRYDQNQFSIEAMEPQQVTVILRGKESALRRLNPNNFQIEADLTNYGPGTFQVPVKAVGSIPSSVSVEVIPQTVKVVIEQMEKKEVPVVMNLVGTPAPGFKAGQPIVKPNRVHVTVPTSKLDDVEFARGEISIDKASSAVTKQVKLSAYDKNGKEIEGAISPSVVDVEVPITSPFKTMPLQVKIVGQPAQGYAIASLKQTPEQITVYGPQDVLDKMDFYSGLQVDITGLKEDKTITLDVPMHPQLTQVDPTKVDMAFTVVPSVTKKLDNVPIIIAGQRDGLITKLTTPEAGLISLTLEGAPAILDKLKLQDVQAFIDVSNLPPGKHDLNVTVNLPPFVRRADSIPITASVEISEKEPAPSAAASPSPSPTASASP